MNEGRNMGIHRVRSKALPGLLAFGGLSAVAGMVGLLTGTLGISKDELAGTPFSGYVLPALILGVIVGGSQLVAWQMWRRQHDWSGQAALVAGAIMTGWIVGEVYLLGSDAGAMRNLQVLFLLVGLLEMGLALPPRSTHQTPAHAAAKSH
jgi:uncharacterized membrane protein YfcA